MARKIVVDKDLIVEALVAMFAREGRAIELPAVCGLEDVSFVVLANDAEALGLSPVEILYQEVVTLRELVGVMENNVADRLEVLERQRDVGAGPTPGNQLVGIGPHVHATEAPIAIEIPAAAYVTETGLVKPRTKGNITTEEASLRAAMQRQVDANIASRVPFRGAMQTNEFVTEAFPTHLRK